MAGGGMAGPLAMLIAPLPVAESMAGFWERVEAWLQDLMQDKPRLARYLAVGYWLSTAFVLLGAVVILVVKLGWWDP